MKSLAYYATRKKYLLPFVMMAAAIFVVQGISVPRLYNPQEPRLSRPQRVKPSTCAVVKTLLQSHQLKVTKSPQPFDLFSYEPQLKNPAVHRSSFRYESLRVISSTVPVVPVRAPPA
jgi:hypothetical protein